MQDNKSIKLSVIIPCWNCSKYITKTLDSIKYSYYMSRKPILEIILVDDGSTDLTSKIIKAYDFGTRAVNVKYHFQNNAGPSKARNQGIKLAQGRYVTFLDSDDIWSPDYLRIIESIMDKYDSEIIEFNAVRFIEENANLKIHNNYTLVDEEYHGPINERILSEVFIKSEWYVWARVYKKKLLEGESFNENITHHEDAEFLPRIYLTAKSISRITSQLIYYRLTQNSITTKPKISSIKDLTLVCELYYENINGPNDKYYKAAMINCLWGLKRLILDKGEFSFIKKSRILYYCHIARNSSQLFNMLSWKKRLFVYLPRTYIFLNSLKYKLSKRGA
ncbi:glycosyltransferase family 2 protein [Escherichia coli]|uniref:Glycosyltransferase family 2 protein n=1 Tax=Escherichia coli TaxID=562 RepID=A0A3K0WCE3_ECOLX|nr:glycosyltransferase family 2 protein [Escherichia coli]EEZ8614793.1 glycosyltransferase [Escherichia coli O160]ANQ01423.1 hypothetical protein A9C00_05100 [Escherichia coli]EET5613591.1 glycosyltransferase [Escherichia coli]EET5684962.1 glycosyltransferase [Escherichia coli]EET5811027.1 glycosyltransferase [Escherichia coli]